MAKRPILTHDEAQSRSPGLLQPLQKDIGLFRRKLAVSDLKIKSPSLETVFLKLTGRSLRD